MRVTKRKMMGTIAATFAIMVMGAATTLAAGRIKVRIHVPIPEERGIVYSTTEMRQKAGEQMGTVPKMVDAFSNGIAFREGYMIKVQGMDENQNEVASTPQVSAGYGENGRVLLLINKQQDWFPQETQGVVKKEIYKEIPLTVEESYYLDLPEGKQPSEEDLKLQAEGKMDINYGSSEEERWTSRGVVWSENGMNYSLSAGEDIELDALIGMAKEIIDVK